MGRVAWLVVLVGASARAAAITPSPVADAAERGDRVAVAALLKEQADPRIAQPDGTTALHWAATHGDAAMARGLLAAGADPRAANRFGVPPLVPACVRGDGDTVRVLLGNGADPRTAVRGGETALMTASRTGVVGPVVALLERGADPDARDRRGQTALMWAAAEGHAEVVRLLAHAGADLHAADPAGFTALMFATRAGRLETTRTLLGLGAEVGETITAKPASGKHPARDTTPLILAIENGHFELAALLLDAGADPNDQRTGFTPLHTLSWVRKPNRGDGDDGEPAPDAATTDRVTSLQLAALLVRHGADVNAPLRRGASGRGVLNRTGATPFLLAAMTADLPLMQTLIALGADPTRPNVDGATPLMAAAGVGSLAPGEEAGTEPEALAAVRFLLERVGDPNTVDRNGETAMHGAAYKNMPSVVRFLAAHGARRDVWDRPNKHGWTPRAIAEGHRPGNFKPSPDTLAAIDEVSRP